MEPPRGVDHGRMRPTGLQARQQLEQEIRQQTKRAEEAEAKVQELELEIQELRQLRSHDRCCKQAARRGEEHQKGRANRAEAAQAVLIAKVRELTQQVKDLESCVSKNKRNRQAGCPEKTKKDTVEGGQSQAGSTRKMGEGLRGAAGQAPDSACCDLDMSINLADVVSSDASSTLEATAGSEGSKSPTASVEESQSSDATASSSAGNDSAASSAVPEVTSQEPKGNVAPWWQSLSLRACLAGVLCSEVRRDEAAAVETVPAPQSVAPPLKALQPSTPRPDHQRRRGAYRVREEAQRVRDNDADDHSPAGSAGTGKSPSSFLAAAPDSPSPWRTWRLGLYKALEQDRLFYLEGRLRKLGRAMHHLLLDPLTLGLIKDPVTTPDGTTYDANSIMSWIAHSATDPHTRMPLSAGMLRPNQQARDLLALFRMSFPELQETETSEKPPRTKALEVGKELFEAIVTWQEINALEILAGGVDDEILNGMFEYEGRRGSLLFWALCCDAPTVAVALLRRNDFRMLLFNDENGLSPLQLASAMGYKDICQELLKRLPLPMAVGGTPEALTLQLPDGVKTIPAQSTAMAIARLAGHLEIVELFETALLGPPPPAIVKL